MKTVVFNIQTLDTALADFATAWKTGKGGGPAQIGFETWQLMHKVLSPKRLEIIRVMAGAGPLSIREIARRLGRDFKGVHSDATLLLKAGVIDKAESGKLVFPYDKIHVDFEISAAGQSPAG
jgi:predicted transcriptional regulator